MRLLIALPDPDAAQTVKEEMERAFWDVTIARDGCAAQALLLEEAFDLFLFHQCLPKLDGAAIGTWLSCSPLTCPPRVVYVRPAESGRPLWADAAVAAGCSLGNLCRLLIQVAQKPLPAVAAAGHPVIHGAVEAFLDQIALCKRYKGRAYAGWLLERLIPSPALEKAPVGQLYALCANTFGTTSACVERCLRVAVESVFTQGSMDGIEQFFGATVDPERGKPTNRAFLLQATCQIRIRLAHSRTDARSPKSIDTHQSPAAPTSV